MDLGRVIQKYGLDAPVGLGGCRAPGDHSFKACAYDLFVFDGMVDRHDTILDEPDGTVVVRHASLSESDSGRLLQYDGLKVIQDASWEIRTLLLGIKNKRDMLYNDHARNSLIESMFCCQRAAESARRPDVFAPCWQRCASFYLADAICSLNRRRSSPSHMLETLRGLPKSPVNDHLATVMETVGTERATPTLLGRMAGSTTGFSDMVAKRSGYGRMITRKHDFFVREAMLADCYFYLGYINKEMISRARNVLARSPELIHILRVAIDVETDSLLLDKNVKLILGSCRILLEHVSGSRLAAGSGGQ